MVSFANDNAPAAALDFTLGECSLGALLVAASDKGVCTILLGDDADQLVRDFQERFPAIRGVRDDSRLERILAAVAAFVDRPAHGLALPLDARGTAFQRRVWQALQEIPAGSTASYGAVAERIGSPNAVRAVAQACAANPIAVAIPCHRVVRSDGGLSGYRWGVDRKRALLRLESAS